MTRFLVFSKTWYKLWLILANMLSLFLCTSLHSYKYYVFTKYVVKTMYTFKMKLFLFWLPHFCDVTLLHLLLNLVLTHMFLAHLAIYTAVYISEIKYYTYSKSCGSKPLCSRLRMQLLRRSFSNCLIITNIFKMSFSPYNAKWAQVHKDLFFIHFYKVDYQIFNWQY